MRGRRGIRGQLAPVRTALYMAAFCASKYNPLSEGLVKSLEDGGKAVKKFD